MASVERKLELLENIARLRRVQGRLLGDRDLAAVRAALERELGETVSRRLAARLLGTSHTALNRWIASRDLPTVYSREGREEVPVPALLDLYQRVLEARKREPDRAHVLERVMSESRRRTPFLAEPAPNGQTGAAGHAAADLRSLAYHRAIAGRLSLAMVAEALYRVWKWHEEGKLDPRYAEDWETVLRMPLAEIRQVISEDSVRGRALRQNSPLAGMLPEPERRRIIEAVR